MRLELFTITIALIVGLGLGLFYFGGLWLTVQQLPTTKHPYRLLGSSLLFRLGISLFLFYLLVEGDLGSQNLVSLGACMSGFLLIRSLLILYLKPH